MSKPLIALQAGAPTLPGARETQGHAASARAPSRRGKGTEKARPEEPSPSITAENCQGSFSATGTKLGSWPPHQEGSQGAQIIGQGWLPAAWPGACPGGGNASPCVRLSSVPLHHPRSHRVASGAAESAASLLCAVGQLSSSGVGVGQPGGASGLSTAQHRSLQHSPAPAPEHSLPHSWPPAPSGAHPAPTKYTAWSQRGSAPSFQHHWDSAIREGHGDQARSCGSLDVRGCRVSALLLGEAPRGTAPNHAGPARLRFMAPG